MNKFLIAIAALAVLISPAAAGSTNQFENWQKNRNQPPPGLQDDHNYNYNYNYTYKYKNRDWYQNPYLWGSVAGAIGQMLQPPPQYGMPPVYPGPGMGGPECGMFWTQVFIPGKGYVPYQTTVCP